MKKIKLKLEYQCFPTWLYDEDNNLLDNDLPPELIGDNEVDPLCVLLQQQFDSLYEDNGEEFRYVGFKDVVTKEEFIDKLSQIMQRLSEKIGEKYIIQNDIDTTKL